MNKKLLLILLAVFATQVAAPVIAASYTSTEVAPGIHMISGVDGFVGGGMSLLVGETYVAMIDDGVEPLASDLQKFVTGIAGRPIDFMVNTHVHGDHVGGNAHFAGRGAVVFAHENIRERLLESPAEAGGAAGLPVVTFGEGVTFHIDELEARVIHVPAAHTDGDAFIHFPSQNVIHAGDVLFHGVFPYIDIDNGGSVDGFVAAMQKVLALADEQTRLIPGHGTLTDKAGMEADLDMLLDSRERVKALVAKGLSADEIVAANPLADYHETYNWNFITTERMTRQLHRDLQSPDVTSR